jgi:hypothetical protein
MKFAVDRFPRVSVQIRDLAKKAKRLGFRDEYIDALRKMMDELENRPQEWGDPEYNTRKPGGVVCHGIAGPLFVRYVVYASHQVVTIINISPLPYSPLAGS